MTISLRFEADFLPRNRSAVRVPNTKAKQDLIQHYVASGRSNNQKYQMKNDDHNDDDNDDKDGDE